MMPIRVRVHAIDGGRMAPEYVGGSIPALKCVRCLRFIPNEATRIVERVPTESVVRDIAPKVQVPTMVSRRQHA